MMRIPRSPVRMGRSDTLLLVIDFQERLIPVIADSARVVWNARRLIDAAALFEIPIAATEQYPERLGATVSPLRERLAELGVSPVPKRAFTCGDCDLPWDREFILITGVEAHICIQQTALDLLGMGRRVVVAVDAVGSRFIVDRDTAFRRLESAGAIITTTESTIFEWCETSESPQFREISRLARETPDV